jgi:hypothetical protein
MPSENLKPVDVDYGASWGSNEYDFKTPSGAWCRLQKLDPLSLIERGLLGRLDFISSVVLGEHIPNAEMSTAQRVKAQRAIADKTPEELAAEVESNSLKELMENPQRISQLREVLDEVAIQAVVQPRVHPVPKTADQREASLVYTDMISFGDKMAIFNSIMAGVNSLQQFREVPREVVGDVAPESGVRKPAQRRPRATSKRKSG